MFFDYDSYSYYVRPGFTDARKSFRTLSCIVDEELNLDSRSKVMFIFCNKARNTLKILVSLLPGKCKLDDVIEFRKQIAEVNLLKDKYNLMFSGAVKIKLIFNQLNLLIRRTV